MTCLQLLDFQISAVNLSLNVKEPYYIYLHLSVYTYRNNIIRYAFAIHSIFKSSRRKAMRKVKMFKQDLFFSW